MRQVWLWLGGLVVLVGIAAAALFLYPSMRFRSVLDSALHQLPAGYTASYETASYSLFTGQAMIGGVKVKAPDAGQFEVALDAIELDHPTLDLPARWDAASTAAGEAAPVARNIAIKKARVRLGPEDISVDSYDIAGFRLYPQPLIQSKLPSAAELRQAFEAARTPGRIADLEPLLRFEAALLLAVGYDSYRIEQIHISLDLPASPSAPAIQAAYAIRSMSSEGTERGTLQGGAGEGFVVEVSPFGTAKIDRVSIGKSDLRGPLEKVLAGAALEPALLDELHIGVLEYSGISFQPSGGRPIPLGTFKLSKIEFRQGMPSALAFSLDGVKLSREQATAPPATTFFEALGIDAATVSFGLAYDWDTGAGRASLHDTALKVAELGALDIAADLVDAVPPSNLTDGAASAVRLSHARLHYVDASLTERLLRIGADKNGVDAATFRQNLVTQAEQQAVAPDASPAMAAALRAVAAFLRAPHSLFVELAPPRPVAVASLGTLGSVPPPQLFTFLGIAVSASP
jgi:hypothetical protein